MLITRRHGSWVVLGTLVSDVELEATAPLDAGCGECRLCIDACPTGALDEPGTLDATKCLSYWLQAPASIPEEYRAAVGAQVYGCDICQDVCPWNRGVRKHRDAPASTAGHVDLVDWLEADGHALVDEFERLYVPQQRPAMAPPERARRARKRRKLRARARCSPGLQPTVTTSSASMRAGRSNGSGRARETTAPTRVVDQHHPPRSGSVRDSPGVADRGHPVPRPSGGLGGDRAARRRRRPAVCAEPPRRRRSADAARDGVRLPDRLELRPAVRVRARHADPRAAADRDSRRRRALRHARRRPDCDRLRFPLQAGSSSAAPRPCTVTSGSTSSSSRSSRASSWRCSSAGSSTGSRPSAATCNGGSRRPRRCATS